MVDAIPARSGLPRIPASVPSPPAFSGGSELQNLMSLTRRLGADTHPFFTGRFLLRVDGLQGPILGAFSEVNGLSVSVEVEDLVEGGQNEFVHRLPKGMKWTNVSLQRGITTGNELFAWLTECSGHGLRARGKVVRREAAVSVLDSTLAPIRTWVLHDAFPVKWTGPTLTSRSRDAALETVELAHHGISVQ